MSPMTPTTQMAQGQYIFVMSRKSSWEEGEMDLDMDLLPRYATSSLLWLAH